MTEWTDIGGPQLHSSAAVKTQAQLKMYMHSVCLNLLYTVDDVGTFLLHGNKLSSYMRIFNKAMDNQYHMYS